MCVTCASGNSADATPLPASLDRRRRVTLGVTLLFLLAALPTLASSSGSPSGTAHVITFSPSVVVLNNPTGASPTVRPAALTNFTVNLTAYDRDGNVLSPTAANPLHVDVYGAPDGVITPTSTEITSGTAVQFTYNGAFFPNNIEIAAWIDDPAGGAALGTTLFVQQNRPTCVYGASSFNLDMVSTVPDTIKVKAVVGADNPQDSDFLKFAIDTGSLGVVVSKNGLTLGSKVHGPGAKGQKYYDSSGYIFTGDYYLAPVSLELSGGGYVQSNPILVLVITGAHCDKAHKGCVAPKPDLHYLGIGFDRNSSATGDLFDSPSENASLELTDALNGTDINAGYILSTQGVTMGITSANATGFNTVTLDPNPTVPGDWNAEPGCYGFPNLPNSPQFCGNLLLDVGISEMFIDLPFSERPSGSYGSNNEVPQGVEMSIEAGPTNNPAMSYQFSAVQPPTQPTGAAPTYVRWINDANIFVNTGRRPLLAYNYLYSGTCGQVGFQPVSSH